MVLIGCGGSSGGSDHALYPPASEELLETQGKIVVETQATTDYRSVSIGSGDWSSLVFTGFYRAWFTRVEYRPAPGWLCGQSASDFAGLIISREDGTGAKILLRTSFETGSHSINSPRWSPDRSRIAFTDAGFSVLVCNADGTDLHKVAEGSGFGSINGVCWAPDGMILYDWENGGQTDLYTVNPDTVYSMPVKITDDAAEDVEPDVSPDGRWIAWARRASSSDDWDIYCMPRGGSVDTDAKLLVALPEYDARPRWSPDNRYIAYIHDVRQVMIVDSVTGARRILTNPSSSRDRSCDWSADGQYVFFTRDDDLYRIRADGSPGDEELIKANWGKEIALRAATASRYRVLIGPLGSDRGGANPPFGAKRAGIITVQSADRLVSAVSFMVDSSDTAIITDRTPEGARDVAVCEVKAGHVRRVFEDNGPAVPRNVWLFDTGSTIPGAVVIVFNADTGKVSSVVALWDQVGSSAATGPTVALEDGKLVVRGTALSVYDAHGQCVSGSAPVGRAVLDAKTGEPIVQ